MCVMCEEGAVCTVRAVCMCVYGMCGANSVVCVRLCICVVCVFVVCDGHEHISSVALLHFLRLLDVGPNSPCGYIVEHLSPGGKAQVVLSQRALLAS